MTTRTVIKLDTPTLQFCASLARTAADGLPAERAHQHVAAAALRVLAEEIEAVAKADAAGRAT